MDTIQTEAFINRLRKSGKADGRELHPTYAACLEALRLRELHQGLAAYNDEMDSKGGWKIFDDPERVRQESLAYEAEVRVEWILAEDRYQRMSDADFDDYDDLKATEADVRASLRSF